MAGIPRHRPYSGPVLFSSGFRPFFLAAALWAAVGVPAWLLAYGSGVLVPSAMPAFLWHPHEMIYGYAAATVAGFLLTAIPNWTGRLPLQGLPLVLLVSLWLLGRVAVLVSGEIGTDAAAVADLSFPAAFLAVVAREIVAGKNWRNLPMLVALTVLLIGNLLVHLEVLDLSQTAQLGNRIGIGALLALISLVGGRIVPSFTRNWLAKEWPNGALPAPADRLDSVALIVTVSGILVWIVAPDDPIAGYATLAAGVAVAVRLARWCGAATVAEPLLLILHIGYGWLAVGLLLVGMNVVFAYLPQTVALHALTVGAVGTMTLAVMTRASLGHTGRPLSAGLWTIVIYALITAAAILRLIAPLCGTQMLLVLWLAAAAWSASFGLFALLYGLALARPRVSGDDATPI